FSLGSVLYTLCTGRPPFRAPTTLAVLMRVCEETPRPIHELNPDIPDWLEAIIAKLHAKDPAQRFQSAADLAAALEGRLAGIQARGVVEGTAPRQPGSSTPETVPVVKVRPRRAPVRRWRGLAAAGAVLLALGAVAAYVCFTQPTEETVPPRANHPPAV